MPAEEPGRSSGRTAAYFDRWYADMTTSTARDAIVAAALGLPPSLHSTSTLPWEGIAEMAGELRLPPCGRLLDLACGRGGYGIEVARRTGARLLGVDFSRVALEQARSSAARSLAAGRWEFRTGTLAATGLPAGIADAVMCVDAVQFAEPPLAALRESRRLLVAGGRLVLSGWEASDLADPRVPARIAAVDLRRDLPAAGFVEVAVHPRPEWRAAERSLWERALAAPEDSDPAVRSLQAEGRRALDAWHALCRVFATATAP